MGLQLINIGFGNVVSASRVISIVSPESAPIKRIVTVARDNNKLVDATYGRRTRAVIITDSDQDRKSTRLNSSHVAISYAVFCVKEKRTEVDEGLEKPGMGEVHGVLATGHIEDVSRGPPRSVSQVMSQAEGPQAGGIQGGGRAQE